MEGSFDDYSIFFNTGTNFCSKIAFIVQFNQLLSCCYTAKNIVPNEKSYLIFVVTSFNDSHISLYSSV